MNVAFISKCLQGGGGNGNGGGGGLIGEPGQYLQLSAKKEPLLPTPPNTQMVKLDTTLTCQWHNDELLVALLMRWYRRFNIAFAWENYQSCVTIEALECMFSQRKCTCEILRIVAGGVPLHVMEIVSLPPDGTPERQQAFQVSFTPFTFSFTLPFLPLPPPLPS